MNKRFFLVLVVAISVASGALALLSLSSSVSAAPPPPDPQPPQKDKPPAAPPGWTFQDALYGALAGTLGGGGGVLMGWYYMHARHTGKTIYDPNRGWNVKYTNGGAKVTPEPPRPPQPFHESDADYQYRRQQDKLYGHQKPPKPFMDHEWGQKTGRWPYNDSKKPSQD